MALVLLAPTLGSSLEGALDTNNPYGSSSSVYNTSSGSGSSTYGSGSSDYGSSTYGSGSSTYGSGSSSYASSYVTTTTTYRQTTTTEGLSTSSTLGSSTTPVDHESTSRALSARVSSDGPAVEDILDRWVPQIASSADGSSGPVDLRKFHRNVAEFDASYSTVVLVQSSDFTSFKIGAHYVALVSETFSSSDGALQWCRNHRRPVPDSCFAKIVSRRQGPSETTKTK